MKDLHAHILMGIDDGSQDLKTSLEILRQAEKEHITDIILTPHYIKNSRYKANNKQKIERLEALRTYAKRNKIAVNLYIGNEVYIDEDILSLLYKGEIATLNHSRYILIELPFMHQVPNLDEILFTLMQNNYIPIIAHPERYHYFQENPFLLKDYIDRGILFQGNYRSLFGYYGKAAKKTLKILLKNDMIHFLASDMHKANEKYKIDKLNKKLLKITKNRKKVFDLLNGNITRVIYNQDISI